MRMPHVIQRLVGGGQPLRECKNTCVAPTLNAAQSGVLIIVCDLLHIFGSQQICGSHSFLWELIKVSKFPYVFLINAHFNAITVVGKLAVTDFITGWNTSLKLNHP